MISSWSSVSYPAIFMTPLPVNPTPRVPLDVHAADPMGGIHWWQFKGLLRRSNTSCGELLIKTLNVNIAIVFSPWKANQDLHLTLAKGHHLPSPANNCLPMQLCNHMRTDGIGNGAVVKRQRRVCIPVLGQAAGSSVVAKTSCCRSPMFRELPVLHPSVQRSSHFQDGRYPRPPYRGLRF